MTMLLKRPVAAVMALGLVATMAAISVPGCASKEKTLPSGTSEPDKWLFERGQTNLQGRKWFKAREYFRQLIDSYPQSSYRPDAKLGLGDTYLGEGTVEALVFAENEFSEFLTFYPTSPRADYAQYRLGLVHSKQMAKPGRDQTQTREAISEFRTFLERYPNSPLLPDAHARLREARDRLGQSEYAVGLFYFRARWYPGAIDRFRALLKDDPEYSFRDAVYYHLAEALAKIDRKAEALPYLERLVQEYEKSEYLERAKKRMQELKAALTPGLAPTV
jgi:outer membrane protein assembly factor BamD